MFNLHLKRVFTILLAFCHVATHVAILQTPISGFPPDVIKLAKTRRVLDIIHHYGYQGQEYTIQTEDGYLLEIQRLPNPGGPAILLMHGLRGSSIHWVMMGPWSDLVYLLHDHGYDVWLGNSRGTKLGQKHISLGADQAQFWNFSLHEIGLYDVPAAIDFILTTSGQKQLSYVGHSQGSAVLYILTSLRPEYNEKIAVMHALAPAVFMHNLRSQFKTLARLYLKAFEYPYYDKVDDINYSALCHSSSLLRQVCIELFAAFYGPSEPGAINFTMTPVLLAHFPDSCSIRQIAHYYQIHRTARFAQFDFDFRQQKQVFPTLYPLERVNVHNAIYYCGDDYLVDARDVRELITKLSKVLEVVFVQKCSHLDPIISTNARKEFHEKLLKIDKKFRRRTTFG